MLLRLSAAVVLVALLPKGCEGWKGSVGGGFNAEVDDYKHGIMRTRYRRDGKQTYEVSDVVVTEPESKATAAIPKISTDASSISLEGLKATFQSGTQQVIFEITATDHESDNIEGTFTFPSKNKLYGIPEHAMDLPLQDDRSYRLMNLDVFEYKLDDTGGIYGTMPFLQAHSTTTGLTVGILWLNSADTSVSIKTSGDSRITKWESKGGIYDVFFFPGPTPADVLRQYSYITGKMALHPLFSLGYHQCRWNYRSEDDTLEVDEGFDKHYIPYDVIWLDIEHTDGKRYFTWDAHNFPNPERMINKIASRGRKVVTISDPHIKRASGYHVHETATEKGYYVKTASGSDFEGHCWPGQSSWLDYYNSDVRDWYATLFRYDMYKGSTPDLYIWIDMNEPSVFNAPEVTMDMTAVHTHKNGNKATHRELHNMYGYYQTMAAYQGLYERSLTPPHTKTTRPFILSRSFFSGSQKYAAVWTGDNKAEWSHLDISAPMLLSMSVAGLPFVGADVGGFFGNPEEELLIRWYQFGAYYPFFRGHAHLETKRREPWLFGEETTASIRKAIVRRYQLLPYIYTQFFRAHRRGESVIMPLYFEFPKDARAADVDRQILLGPAVMVKPVVASGVRSVQYYLPSSPWYDLYTGESYNSGDLSLTAELNNLPALVRGGHIIPKRERVRRSTAAQFWDPITLVIALDKTNAAEGELYLDDSHSFEYQQGSFVHRRFQFSNGVLTNTKYVDDSPYATKVCRHPPFMTLQINSHHDNN
eukprot:TRINITY_DN4164_c2_g1_i3.p1 TRINITY_DN4164_c2_g1~~TRINITY_DN4164_c2_g1_i3.p1  ORF type:complete len:759 (+),score=122.02 TRINITY_DN4164_c2_g1_i3:47-2323(+)